MLGLGLVLASALAGALSYRMRGGGFVPDYAIRRPVDLSLWALVIAAPLLWASLWLGALAAVWTGLLSSLGHGSGLDFGRSKADDPDELWRNRWAPKDSPKHDFLFMVVSGLLISLGPGLAAGLVLGWPWALLCLSGAFKGPAYWVGFRAWKAGYGGDTTALSELLFGAALGFSFGLCWLEVG
jgi:hypothetical protein